MIYINAAFTQQHAPAELPAAVRAALGKPLRRASALTQLALLGALASLPAERRSLPTALLWQSTRGPRLETRAMLDEVCAGAGEPMPFEFLATQPALAAAQIQPFLPGLQSAMHFPLDTEGVAHWSLLLGLASNWLKEGRYAQVLCAHLDSSPGGAEGHWLALGAEPLENRQIGLHIGEVTCNDHLPDTPDFPNHLANWLQQASSSRLMLLSPGTPQLTVEFARL
ncbi:MAG: hypothetical protein Q8S26_01090 [Azonexus sp.]|nr:hypothetical protein [Azonexus sp.]